MVAVPAKSAQEWIFELEELISSDPGWRGVSYVRCTGELFHAALALWERCGKRSNADSPVVIATGFYVPEAEAIETDGPLGAFALARALASLGVRAVLVSDEDAALSLRRALRTEAERAERGERSEAGGDGGRGGGAPGLAAVGGGDVVSFPGRDQTAAVEQTCAKLAREAEALVAIERVGPAADGRCYTSRGTDVTDRTAPIERLFHRAASYGVLTIGIGDGGNEIGMGKVWSQVARHIPDGRRIGCAVPTDWLVAGGVSNWAAYGLVAALSVLSGRSLLPEADEERASLEAHVGAGLVDGITFRSEMSVDGIAWSEHEALLDRLHDVVGRALEAARNVS